MSNYVVAPGYVAPGGLAEMGGVTALALPAAGLWGGIVYGSRTKRSKLLYGVVGFVAGGFASRLLTAASK